jgi:hypothetical protein
MVEQGVDERAAIALVFGGSCAGVDHHPGGLVDDGEVIVFVADVERNFFGDGAERRTCGRTEDGDVLAAAELQRCFGGCVVDQDLLFRDELLDAGAANIVYLSDEELIEALACGVGGSC